MFLRLLLVCSLSIIALPVSALHGGTLSLHTEGFLPRFFSMSAQAGVLDVESFVTPFPPAERVLVSASATNGLGDTAIAVAGAETTLEDDRVSSQPGRQHLQMDLQHWLVLESVNSIALTPVQDK